MRKTLAIVVCAAMVALLSACAAEKSEATLLPSSTSSSTSSSSNSSEELSSTDSASNSSDSSSDEEEDDSSKEEQNSSPSSKPDSFSDSSSSNMNLPSEPSKEDDSSSDTSSFNSSYESGSNPSSSNLNSSSLTSSATNQSSSTATSNPSSSNPSGGLTSSNPSSLPEDEDTAVPPTTENPIIPQSYRVYDSLTPLQQKYYENMLNGINNMQLGWIVLGESQENYLADVALVRNAVLTDHPEIFWVPTYYATAEATSSGGDKNVVIYFSVDADAVPSFLYTEREKEKMEKELEKAVNDIASKVTAKTAYEVELQLHDLLCEITEYNDDDSEPSVYTAYGALVNKKALCEGYSKAMQLLLQKFGIAATVVSGVADGEDHMWNLVLINDEWYNLDVTWNDMIIATSHEYFNLSDQMISFDHSFHPSFGDIPPEEMATGGVAFNINRPKATGTEFNYFNRSGFVLFSDGVSALAAYLARTEGDFVEVRFSDRDFRDLVFESSDRFIARINETLAAEQKNCGFRIGGYSVSATVLRLYKKKN